MRINIVSVFVLADGAPEDDEADDVGDASFTTNPCETVASTRSSVGMWAVGDLYVTLGLRWIEEMLPDVLVVFRGVMIGCGYEVMELGTW